MYPPLQLQLVPSMLPFAGPAEFTTFEQFRSQLLPPAFHPNPTMQEQVVVVIDFGFAFTNSEQLITHDNLATTQSHFKRQGHVLPSRDIVLIVFFAVEQL